jgi:hypothetical protein
VVSEAADTITAGCCVEGVVGAVAAVSGAALTLPLAVSLVVTVAVEGTAGEELGGVRAAGEGAGVSLATRVGAALLSGELAAVSDDWGVGTGQSECDEMRCTDVNRREEGGGCKFNQYV